MDVCTGFCSVAVVDETNTLAAKHEPMTRGHVERLAPMVTEVLDEAGLIPGDLDGIAVTTGPGSFTGARLGVSFARGLALATSIPAIGISVFEAIQSGQSAETIVALPGKNGSLLLQRFTASGQSATEPADFDAASAHRILPGTGPFNVIGSATATLMERLSSEDRARSHQCSHIEVNAVTIAQQGMTKLKNGMSSNPAPLYVRAADAKPQVAVNLG